MLIGAIVLVALIAAVVVYMPNLDAQSLYNWFKDNMGYTLIFLLMAVESSFIPFPSEIVVPPAAYFACTGASHANINVVMVVVVATLGALVGACVNYLISMFIGRPVIYGFANSRIGHMCLIDAEKVEKSEKYFASHGAVSTFLGRLIPGIRQLISIPAGLARMNFVKFCVFTSLGAGIWNVALAVLGWWLSTFVAEPDLYAQLEANNKYLTYAGFALFGVIVLYIAYKGLKAKPMKTK